MFYENWMSYLTDDAKITKVAMPGAHNAATKGMIYMGCCQNGTLLEQYKFGVRKFGIRLKKKHGKLYIGHGMATGIPAEEAFESLGKIVENYDDFFIIDLRCYPDQKVIGRLSFHYDCDPSEVDELIEKYLQPEKYALTDIPDLKELTIGDIRKSGKKYVINNEKKLYKYSQDIKLLEPWDAKVFGLRPEKFCKECVNYLRNLESEGFFWLQTQQTPDLNTELGLKWPAELDRMSRLYFRDIMDEIASDRTLVEKLNIVAGDFMTADHIKENHILYFNLLKDIVKPELRSEYAKMIGKKI